MFGHLVSVEVPQLLSGIDAVLEFAHDRFGVEASGELSTKQQTRDDGEPRRLSPAALHELSLCVVGEHLQSQSFLRSEVGFQRHPRLLRGRSVLLAGLFVVRHRVELVGVDSAARLVEARRTECVGF